MQSSFRTVDELATHVDVEYVDFATKGQREQNAPTLRSTIRTAAGFLLFTAAVVMLGFVPSGGLHRLTGLVNLKSTYAGPAMEHFGAVTSVSLTYNYSDPSGGLPKMMGNPSEVNSETWLGDKGFSKVPGKELTTGFFRMNAGPPLDYTYTYEELKLIVDGEFHLTDGTGQKVVARKGDLMHFPKGSHIIFDTPHTAMGYFCGQRRADTASGNTAEDAETEAAIASNPPMVHIPQITSRSLPKMTSNPSEVHSATWLGDFGFSRVVGKEVTTGLFRMNAGPPLDYTYDYEELKLILEGEFHLSDGTGQEVVARAGDLMHFPNGSKIVFNTPKTALGYYCGQRKGSTA